MGLPGLVLAFPDAVLDELDATDGSVRDASTLRVTRDRVEIEGLVAEPNRVLIIEPAPVNGVTWAATFDAVCARHGFGPVEHLEGLYAAAVVRAWNYVRAAARTRPRARGRPVRSEARLDVFRNEVLARVLQLKRAGWSTLGAIRQTQQENPRRFAKAFPNGAREQRIQAARRHLTRLKQEANSSTRSWDNK